MNNNEAGNQQQLTARIELLEKAIRSIATAPNKLEQDARIEVALAKVQGRQPEMWATEYMNYATSKNKQYF